MKISFVIPAYNEEAYIGKCLESILRETKCGLCDYEVIVVNNASTDKTREEAAKFPGVKIVEEKNKGLTRARQAGLNAAKGDILVYIDADTLAHKEWFEVLNREFSLDPELICFSGPYRYYGLPENMNRFLARKISLFSPL